MLPKKSRVSKDEIALIFKNGRFINSPNLTFKYIIQKGQSTPKIAFIVPKTTSKKAVSRNLLRRRGYVVLKNYFDQIPHPMTGVFIFNKNSLQVFGQRKSKNNDINQYLHNEIKNILNKIN
ncbi:MAG: ribonuclease P protein component [Candidatus Pacebacteria bacterium]|jgi:ribonuclease P protein component|nr:ribonuclease P protein component [Candidatus Paceibacterota bacterium]